MRSRNYLNKTQLRKYNFLSKKNLTIRGTSGLFDVSTEKERTRRAAMRRGTFV